MLIKDRCIMTEEEQKLREQICDIGKNLWTLGFVAANDGNISVRLADGSILTTPTGMSKKNMKPEMLIRMSIDNEILECPEGYRPSSEFKMHLACYRNRHDVMAVVHAHPPTATGFAVAHKPLDNYAMSEAAVCLGSVPVAPFATPSTDEVPNSIIPYLPYHDAIMLANHGVITMGINLTEAYYRMETVEHYAKVSLVAEQLGGPVEIPQDKIPALCEIAKTYKVRHPGYRKYSK